MINLKSFYINEASYLIEDKNGSRLRMDVIYKDNKFDIVFLEKGENVSKLKNQAEVIAKDMLKRKAKKNLVEKLLQLKV